MPTGTMTHVSGLILGTPLDAAWREGRKHHAAQMTASHRVATVDALVLDPITLPGRVRE